MIFIIDFGLRVSGSLPGVKNVVVTLGGRGCLLVSSTTEGYRRFAAAEVEVTDTVGAGDAFLGSMGAYLSRGLTLEEAIEKAVRYI